MTLKTLELSEKELEMLLSNKIQELKDIVSKSKALQNAKLLIAELRAALLLL